MAFFSAFAVTATTTAAADTTSRSSWCMNFLRSALLSLPPLPASSIRFPHSPSSSSSRTLRISRSKPKALLPSFSGLVPLHPLFLLGVAMVRIR
ncbi:hypothetical protein S83_066256 [Arachis hypogaea]